MDKVGRWPKSDTESIDAKHKLGECIWWLIILADRMNIDINEAFENFLSKTESLLE